MTFRFPSRHRLLLMSLFWLFAGAIAACSTIGELSPNSEPAAEVSSSPTPTPTLSESSVILETSDWKAWADFMPGIDTPSLHIEGQVQLPNPGYEVSLVPVSQDNLAATLVFELQVTEKDGNWVQVVTTKPVEYEDSLYTGNDQQVQIRLPNGSVKEIKVERVY
jgi:hypothetical protein